MFFLHPLVLSDDIISDLFLQLSGRSQISPAGKHSVDFHYPDYFGFHFSDTVQNSVCISPIFPVFLPVTSFSIMEYPEKSMLYQSSRHQSAKIMQSADTFPDKNICYHIFFQRNHTF